MTGLAPKTRAVIHEIANLSCLNGFVLVGGTAISVQMNHRLSKDLDFCKWVSHSTASNGISVRLFESELAGIFTEVKTNHLGFDQVDFFVHGVKLTFFNEVGFSPPAFSPIPFFGNIHFAPLSVLASMKMKAMFERTKFRDYYDLYVQVKEKAVSLSDLIDSSMAYHSRLTRQMIINRLTRWERIDNESSFRHLSPKYAVDNR